MTWPTHPDGSNKTMGEMTPGERREQISASVRRVAAKSGWTEEAAELAAYLSSPSHSLADIAAANPDAPWSRQLRMQGETER